MAKAKTVTETYGHFFFTRNSKRILQTPDINVEKRKEKQMHTHINILYIILYTRTDPMPIINEKKNIKKIRNIKQFQFT